MNDYDFEGYDFEGYNFPRGGPGDTPNGAWVREQMRKKGFRVDMIKLAQALPAEVIDILFYDILREGGLLSGG